MNTAKVGIPAVIVVEDNVTLRDELVLFLSEEGFDVRGVSTGEELNVALQAQRADILILDLNLPAEDGISITRRVRRALPTVGIIILSARVRSTDRLEGYATGADVYLTKPTRPDELAAVVRNLFGRVGSAIAPVPWQLDMAGLILQSPTGAEIRLTGSEALLLKALALNGQFMDHSALMARFGDEALSEKINKARIEVLISRLRAKLGPYLAEGFDIKALRGRGYQLGFLLVVKNLNSSK
jgi:DNA-binding response OmpR family regulator